jgi:mTERF domain-containing protein, mitochondrial
MLLKYPWILSTTVIENYRQMLLFFNRKKVAGRNEISCYCLGSKSLSFTYPVISRIIKSFFYFQISKPVLDVAVKSWSHVLGCSTKRMSSILDLLDDLGISKKMAAPVITSSPQLLLRKLNEFLQVYRPLQSVTYTYLYRLMIE